MLNKRRESRRRENSDEMDVNNFREGKTLANLIFYSKNTQLGEKGEFKKIQRNHKINSLMKRKRGIFQIVKF